jgi:hypothetical protein
MKKTNHTINILFAAVILTLVVPLRTAGGLDVP